MSDVAIDQALQRFAAIVGAEHVITDPAERLLCSRDIFTWDEAPTVDAVIRPGSAPEVAALLPAATAAGVRVAIRGGGVSYTQGYVPALPHTVTLDLSRLNAIHEINVADLYAQVGAACTFEQLDAAVRPHRLRPILRGPISGGVATVGGIAAQNTGSSQMLGICGVEVVLPDGRIVRTGSGGRSAHPSPFYRNYGPDLTGLFLGDTGAFGVKTACTLSLEPIPAGVACASVAFESIEELARAMVDIGRSGIACRAIGMDPVKNRTATRVGIREGLGTLARVVSSADSLGRGLRQAAGIAIAGQDVLKDALWSLHLIVEGHDQGIAERQLAALRSLWAGAGRELPPSVPVAMHARPYSIRGILGIAGERWVPLHGVFAPSLVPDAVRATEAFFAQHADRLAAHHIDHSYILVTMRPHFVMEPMFYWPDEAGPLHARVLGSKFHKFKDQPANPAARAVVRELRGKLADLYRQLGAVHSQIGKFYEYAGNLQPDTYALLSDIKDTVDPGHLLNPGNLGWR